MKTKRHLIGAALVMTSACLWLKTLPARAEEKPAALGWKVSAYAGLNLARGNSETLLINTGVKADWKAVMDEIGLGAEASFGESRVERDDGTSGTEKNVQRASAKADYRRLLSEREYAFISAEGLSDGIADIDYRLIIGPGLGRYFIKSPSQLLGVDLGVSYIAERQDGSRDDRAALRLAQRYELKLSDVAKIWEAAEYLPSLEKFSDYLFNLEVGAEAAMTSRLSLRSTARYLFNSRPAGDKEKYDLLLSTGIGFKI